MRISIQLYGAFRQFQEEGKLDLDCPGATTIGDVRAAMDVYGLSHWRGYTSGLMRTSAFATETELLRASSPIPTDGRLAIIPPVCGG
ncbi:MAG: hypothetical protein J0M09_01325 [Xanthomonadales bacterium]|jgi:molybdopterin synthase sulfur carrier subunit|nr:hypothetical protein [Xanthomonadales bacterium]